MKDGAALPLVWDDPKVMAYVRKVLSFLDAKRFRALPNHGRASVITYADGTTMTVCEA